MPRRIWGPRVDEDVDDELRLHLELREREYVAQGMTPEEARACARRQFGDVEQVRSWLRRHEQQRRRRIARIEHMEALLQDVRYGARKIVQQPWFSLGVVLVLALGVGAATTMFSAVDAALLRPLPFDHHDRLHLLRTVNIPTQGSVDRPKEGVELEDVRVMAGVEAAAAFAPGGLNLGSADRPRRVRVALVTPGFFETLGVQPAFGRTIRQNEGTVEGARVAVVSHALWRRELGGDAAALGRTLVLNGIAYEVVGIMPSRFRFPEDTELWVPMRLPFQYADMEAFQQYIPSEVIARLAPGVGAEAIGDRILAQARALAPESRSSRATNREIVVPLREQLVGQQRTGLLLLLGATGLVLLIACANATNLLLSRAAARRAELTLRAAIGATRARLIRQLLIESTLLALLAGAVGVLVAYASMGGLGALLPTALTGVAEPRLDVRVLAFCVTVAAVTGLVFGIVPALGGARADAAEVLRVAGADGGIGRGGARLRRALVVAEVALALMLAVGAGLMLRTLQSLLSTELGIEPARVGTAELSLPATIYDTPGERRRFQEEVLASLASAQGIEAAAITSRLPLRRGAASGAIGYRISAAGRTARAGAPPVVGEVSFVSPDYFRAMGIPVLRGRPAGARADSTAIGEIVISELTARALWPDEDAVGARLTVPVRQERIVVGVVGDVRSMAVEGEPRPQIYIPIAEQPSDHLALVARGALPASVLAGRLQEAVRAVDPTQPLYNVRTMEEVVASAVAPRRTSAMLVLTFGVIAMVLAAGGVYGVLAYGVAQRRREIGIRMALGADRGDVLRMVVREGATLALLGIALGIVGAWALREVTASLLYGVSPSDAVTFTSAPAALLLVALLAAIIPARSASRVEAMVAMRG